MSFFYFSFSFGTSHKSGQSLIFIVHVKIYNKDERENTLLKKSGGDTYDYI